MSDLVNFAEHPITVLLVDDQPIIGEAVQKMLAAEKDVTFHYCRDPTQAIKWANLLAPTVILQDLVMPEIEGLTLVRYFRTNSATREVPLIVLSTKEEPEIKAEAFALGANDYLVKLPARLELLARIRYHSRAYINFLERNEAYQALLESRRQLEVRNRFIRETFGRYVSDEVVESILETPGGLKIGGEKRLVTILMSDLRGFTITSGRLPAETVVKILNAYLEKMTDIILHHQGTIVEFIGDAIVVMFGAPISRDNDAQRAIACALSMQLAMEDFNLDNQKNGYPKLEMGIGINSGEVIVGNIGSKKRIKYDVIGHHVNLASRIESYTLGGQVFISEMTREICADSLRIKSEMEVMPKGITTMLKIYDVIGIGGAFNVFLSDQPVSEWLTLPQPLVIDFCILEGKHSSEQHYEAKIIKLSSQKAELLASRLCRELTDLRLTVYAKNGDVISNSIYAKVIEICSENPPLFHVHFTALPLEAELYFRDAVYPAIF